MRFLIYFSSLFLSLSLSSQVKKDYYDAEQVHLKSETDYYKGMPHGLHIEYYKSGKVSRKGFYEYGKEDSIWIFYYETGKKKAVENYISGKKWGTNSYYFKSGKVSSDVTTSVTSFQFNPNTQQNELVTVNNKTSSSDKFTKFQLAVPVALYLIVKL